MKSSGLLKWLMIPVALLVLWVMIRVFSGGDGGAATGDRTPRLTPEEMRALGIEGDSPHDTVATLIGQVKQLRTELQGAVADNKVHKTENERLRQRDNQIEQRIRNAVDGEQRKLKAEQQRLEQERRQSQELLQQVQRQMETLSQTADATELPVGLGLRRRRTFDPAFKAELVATCQYPGVSVAAIALEHGLNANLLRRWITEHERYGHHGGDIATATSPAISQCRPASPAPALPAPFVPVSMAATTPNDDAISIDMTRGTTSMRVTWPVSAAAQCAELLREWLR
ncbi:MAG: transposase [Alcaligenaceae bacterium]|nr:transposase [Alcaligenaceae bacterium]